MNKKTNHNSIVFLTTLSVYLGLALVGGNTQVLAQTANQVVVKNESLERKNSLCESFSAESQNLFDKGFFVIPVRDFLRDLENLSKLGKFSAAAPFSELFTFEYDIQDVAGKPVALFGKGTNKPSKNHWFYAAFFDVTNRITATLPNEELRINNSTNKYPNALSQKVKFELSQTEFTVQVSFEAVSAEKADFLAGIYNESFAIGKCSSVNNLYENTRATSENNQVFIVTRLPRGSLDTLLAEKDAQ